jgi:beta-galactosidase
VPLITFETPSFDGIEPLELRYFNDNQREVPVVCHAALQINRNPHVAALAMQMKIHGYVQGDMARRMSYMESIKGFPIVQITDGGPATGTTATGGKALISTMALDKAATDPVAGRLLSNMIDVLLK